MNVLAPSYAWGGYKSGQEKEAAERRPRGWGHRGPGKRVTSRGHCTADKGHLDATWAQRGSGSGSAANHAWDLTPTWPTGTNRILEDTKVPGQVRCDERQVGRGRGGGGRFGNGEIDLVFALTSDLVLHLISKRVLGV